jgi:hypothetical protein
VVRVESGSIPLARLQELDRLVLRLSFSGKAALASSSAPANSNQHPPPSPPPSCVSGETPHTSATIESRSPRN